MQGEYRRTASVGEGVLWAGGLSNALSVTEELVGAVRRGVKSASSSVERRETLRAHQVRAASAVQVRARGSVQRLQVLPIGDRVESQRRLGLTDAEQDSLVLSA